MTEYTTHRETAPARRHNANTDSAWSGWIWFASIIMILTGVFNAVEGLVALLNQAFYVTDGKRLLLFDLTTWGWVHLLVGTLVMFAGTVLLSGVTWARAVAVAVVSFNAVTQVAFISTYPMWSTIVIALSVLVIWAVVVHGRDATGDLL
jgi:hypothetical protein